MMMKSFSKYQNPIKDKLHLLEKFLLDKVYEMGLPKRIASIKRMPNLRREIRAISKRIFDSIRDLIVIRFIRFFLTKHNLKIGLWIQKSENDRLSFQLCLSQFVKIKMIKPSDREGVSDFATSHCIAHSIQRQQLRF